MDDYTDKAWAFDFMSGSWKLNLHPQLNIRPLAYITIANFVNAIPGHEQAARLAMLSVHLLDVFLLASLARRVTGSRFIFATAAAYFLFPIFANEALLWFSTAVANSISLLLLLLGFHLFLRCRSVKEDRRLFISAVGAWILTVLFYESGLFTFLLLPAFWCLCHPNGRRFIHQTWFLALLATYVPLGIYLFFVERVSTEVNIRGGPVLSPLFIVTQRVPDVTRRLIWLLTDWGLSGPLHDALKLGWHEWVSVPGGRAILIGLAVLIAIVAIAIPIKRGDLPTTAYLGGLAAIGLAWAILGLVPILLVRSQIVEIRTLYVPFAGAALFLAALSGLTARLFGSSRDIAVRILLLTAGTTMFFSSIAMAGLVRTYQLRWDLDQKQVVALKGTLRSVPSNKPLWLLPLALDEQMVSKYWGRGTNLDRYLYGVFETPWSARDAVRLAFGDRDIHALTANRWSKFHITALGRSDNGEIVGLIAQGVNIPIDQILAFTYQEDKLVLLDPLEISSADGTFKTTVALPLTMRFGDKNPVSRAHLELDKPN